MKLTKMTQALFELMVNTLAKDGNDIAWDLVGNNADLWHMATGVSGEASELLEVVFENPALTPQDVAEFNHFIEELGDAEFYMQRIAFVLDVKRPEKALEKDYTLTQLGMLFSIHSGHLLDAVKKVVVYNSNEEVDIDKIRAALEKCFLIINEIYETNGLSVEQIVSKNIEKLYLNDNARYGKGGYSDEAAQQRADKAEDE